MQDSVGDLVDPVVECQSGVIIHKCDSFLDVWSDFHSKEMKRPHEAISPHKI
jgi:hypothetical protein